MILGTSQHLDGAPAVTVLTRGRVSMHVLNHFGHWPHAWTYDHRPHGHSQGSAEERRGSQTCVLT